MRMAQLRKLSKVKNDASSLEEVDLKEIIQKKIDFFKDNKSNKIFQDLKTDSYYENLKRDLIENQGIENPVIAHENGTLVEGHSRIKILKELITEGKLPKTYNVPTIIYKGTEEEGTKRLILGNLNRFEIDPDTRTLLFARVYPGYYDPENNTKQVGRVTVTPPPTKKDIAKATGQSEETIKKGKQLVKKAMAETNKPLEKLEPKDLKEVREEKNQERRNKTQEKKSPTSTKLLPKEYLSERLKKARSLEELLKSKIGEVSSIEAEILKDEIKRQRRELGTKTDQSKEIFKLKEKNEELSTKLSNAIKSEKEKLKKKDDAIKELKAENGKLKKELKVKK
jgi:hypothetical protein